jgi:hypothetical protein
MIGENEAEYKRRCRLRALEIGRDMRPPAQLNNGFQHQQLPEPRYDLLKEAESIYQWLIKIDEE